MSPKNFRTLGLMAGLVALGLSFASTPAQAGSNTANLTVSASIAQNCIIATATLPFGGYDPVVTNKSAPLNAQVNMTVTCTKGAAGIQMAIGPTSNTTGCTAGLRCLISNGNLLTYQLYSDSGHTAVWTSEIAETVSGGTTTPTPVTVYGQVQAGQDAAIGAAYADTVVATVNY